MSQACDLRLVSFFLCSLSLYILLPLFSVLRSTWCGVEGAFVFMVFFPVFIVLALRVHLR